MKSLETDYYNSFCSHIYVEKEALKYPETERILSRFPNAEIIEINHYKDVFCRRGQKYVLQHKSQNLILAVKTGTLVYPGAPVCQSFGNEYFYYASCIMNCIYDCEYCYLKGMYPSGNLVVFVNLEDIFAEVNELLKKHPVYLCVSYDTDLGALASVTGYLQEWTVFAKGRQDLKIEIRTKCANLPFQDLDLSSQVIYAFTLSPQAVIDAYEHGTPSLAKRIACAAKAVDAGWLVRLCFDPMIYCADWKMHYESMLKSVFAGLDGRKLLDVSVGTFRVSKDYLKKMRKNEPFSAVVQFPYHNIDGVYQYPKALAGEMEQFLTKRLKEKLPDDKIFLWKNENEVEYV